MTLTLQTFTSWDHVTATDIALLGSWSGSVGSIVAGYDGGRGAVYAPVTLADAVTASTYASFAAFVRFKVGSLASEQLIFAIRTSGTDHLALKLTTSGYLKLETGGSSSDGPWTSTSHDPIAVDEWHGVELGALIDDGAGTTKVLLDGLSVSELDNTSVDTNGHASSFLPDQVVLSNADATFDDYVLSVGTGAVADSDFHSDLSGNPRVATLWPILEGTYTAWTPSLSTSTHDALIGEVRADAEATQLSTQAGNARESWRIQALPDDLDSIEAVDTTYYVRNKTSGERVRHFWRIDSTNYDDSGSIATLPAGGAWTVQNVRWASSPATSVAWTAAELEAAEAGVQRNSPPSADGVAISQGVVVVLYDASQSNVLTVDPSYPIAAWISRRAVVTDASSGYVARRQAQSSVSRQSERRAVRQWQLEWKRVSPTEKATLVSLFDAAIGRAFPIQVQPLPTLPHVEVRFVSDTLTMENTSGQWWRVRALVEEVI